MIPEADTIMQSIDALTPVKVRKAQFLETIDGSAVVMMGDSSFTADFGSGHIPRRGDTVQVLSVGERHLLFPAGPLPGTGTVTTVTSGIVTVTTSIGTFAMPHVGAAPASGAVVGLSWSETPFCLGTLSVQPADPDGGDPTSGAVIRSAIFRAIDAGSTDRHQPRWWTGQPWASDSTFGAWFYGSQLKDSIPAAAQLVSIEMWISKQQTLYGPPNFTLHNSGWKDGVPGMSAPLAWDPEPGWRAAPPSWFDGLKAGGAWWGIGLNQGGYHKFSSLAEDSMSGALRILWRA